MEHEVSLLMTEFVTHDVRRFITTRPHGFDWRPGQGVELAIDSDGWRDETRPFTPTSREEDMALEFTIKNYPEHGGVTQALHGLKPGARLLMSEPFGTIQYQGPGVFIAGGAGITPFIAILRRLAADGELAGNTLIFSNKTPGDVILEQELRYLLGERCILTCTEQAGPGCLDRRVDRDFLAAQVDDFGQHFYVCGPPAFNDAVGGALKDLGAEPDMLVFEE